MLGCGVGNGNNKQVDGWGGKLSIYRCIILIEALAFLAYARPLVSKIQNVTLWTDVCV